MEFTVEPASTTTPAFGHIWTIAANPPQSLNYLRAFLLSKKTLAGRVGPARTVILLCILSKIPDRRHLLQ